MITSISYLSNATSTAGAAQAPADAGAQAPVATPPNISSGAVAQLSLFGQVKASLADLQNNAIAFKALNQPPTFSDFQGVVQSFVQSFNALNKAVNNAPVKQAVLEADNPAKQALSEIRKATFGGNQGGVLGVAQQSNGTLAINQTQLERQFQDNSASAVATFAALSNRVSITADRQLAESVGIQKPLTLAAPVQPSTGSGVRNAVTAYAGIAAL